MRFKLDKSESLVDITETYSVIDIAEDWVVIKDGLSFCLTVLDQTLLMSGGIIACSRVGFGDTKNKFHDLF